MKQLLIMIFISATIGWITNWVAIKMLFRPHKEIKLITDIHSLNEKELHFIKDLDNFLNNKGKILKFFNVHNGKYQNLKEIL